MTDTEQSRHPAARMTRIDIIQTPINIYICGSVINEGKHNAKAGGGIYYTPGDERNRSYRAKSKSQNKISAATETLLRAIQNIPNNIKLNIKLNMHLLHQQSRGQLDSAGQRSIVT